MPIVARRHPFTRTAAVAALAVALTACAGGSDTRMSAGDLRAAMGAGRHIAVVDVRSKGEYEAGHVPGAVHVPFYAMWTRWPEIGAARSEPVVVYCEHGPRAGLARFGLETLGFEQVRSLEGNMPGWRAAGYPVATGPP